MKPVRVRSAANLLAKGLAGTVSLPRSLVGLARRSFREHWSEAGSQASLAGGDAFVLCENLVKIYRIMGTEIMALQGLDLAVKAGEIVGVIGASGSGKSTLMNILGALDRPTAGKARVGRWDLTRMNEAARVRYRLKTVGFVWQNVARNLISHLTALENVELPMVFSGHLERDRARDLLRLVGLEKRMNHLPYQLSGGEQQRVAIAIALANRPDLLLADEPTGSLDSASSKAVLQAFNSVRDRFAVTVIIVTHDLEMARAVDRYVRIRDGKISTESVRKVPPGPRAEGSGAEARTEARPSGHPRGRNGLASEAVAREGARQMTAEEVLKMIPGEAGQKTWGEVLEAARDEGPPVSQEQSSGATHGEPAEATHEEYVVLDSAGRLQVPSDLLKELGIKDRVKLAREGKKIVIEPPEDFVKEE